MANNCDECGGKIVKKRVDFTVQHISLGMFNAEVCQQCGETVFDERTSKQIEQVAKQKGIWGSSRKDKVLLQH